MGDLVGHFYFEGVVAGREGGKRETTVQSDLFAVAAYGAGGFGGGPDFFFVAKEAIRGGGARLAKEFVKFKIVELHEDAESFGVREGARKAWTDFVGAEDELTGADLGGWDEFDFVGEDERAGVEQTFLVLGNAERSADDGGVSGFDVLDDKVETIETGMERDRFLIERRLRERFLEERVWNVVGDGFFECLYDAAAGRADSHVDIDDGGVDAVFCAIAHLAVGDLKGDGDDDGVGGCAKERNVIADVDSISEDAGRNISSQIFEVDWRRA